MASTPHTPFFIPEQILATTKHDHQSESGLLQLPNKILSMIVQKVKIPYYLVVLGLTCKRMAAFLRDRNSYLPPWRGYQDKEGLYRLLIQSRPFTPKHLSKSRQSPAWSKTSDEPLKSYIPQTFRLYRACFVYLPWSRAYWRDKGFTGRVDRFGRISGFLHGDHNFSPCPACDKNEYVIILNQSDLDSMLRTRGREETGCKFCPELERRLLKP